MRHCSRLIACLAAAAIASASALPCQAAILSIDFNNGASPTESGFTGQNSGSATYFTATRNEITVTSSGQQGLFDRGASGGVNNDLYRDFLFDNNSNGFTLTLSGDGIEALTDYVLTFYAYDNADGSRSTTFTGINGTVGVAGPVESGDTGQPDTLDEYATTSSFTSAGDGTLTFSVTGGRTVLNGFELDASVVPEPASLALLGVGGLLIAGRRRR